VFSAAGIEILKIPPNAPRANAYAYAYAKRWVRTVRSECLDWTQICNQQHLRRVLTEDLRHCNTARPHHGLGLRPPDTAHKLTLVKPPLGATPVMQRVDVLGGLIYEYRRAA
jgi:putative transposase